MPPPEPRSSTVSPGLSSARAVGLPHPSDAFTAISGNVLLWESSYKSFVIGSTSAQQHAEAPQHELASPADTRRAASPYFSCTISFKLVLTCYLLHIRVSECLFKLRSQEHMCQGECIMRSWQNHRRCRSTSF